MHRSIAGPLRIQVPTVASREPMGHTTGEDFGIVIQVPLCRNFCSFCSAYKEKYTHQLKQEYLYALLNEMTSRPFGGNPNWVHIMGGTPNLLKLNELSRIISVLEKKASIKRLGMELKPDYVDEDYLLGLRQLGVTEITLGIETLDTSVLLAADRRHEDVTHLIWLLTLARKLNFVTTVSLLAGLPLQRPEHIAADLHAILPYRPNQITIRPYTPLGNCPPAAWPEGKRFQTIEEAAVLLGYYGYQRRTLWTFSQSKECWDPSLDTWQNPVFGFGPGAFSLKGRHFWINAPLPEYLETWKSAAILFSAPPSQTIPMAPLLVADLYRLHLEPHWRFSPVEIFFVFWFRLISLSWGNKLTRLGRWLAYRYLAKWQLVFHEAARAAHLFPPASQHSNHLQLQRMKKFKHE